MIIPLEEETFMTMKKTPKVLCAAAILALFLAACGSNGKSESAGDSTETELHTGDTAVVMDNDSIANRPTVVDSLK